MLSASLQGILLVLVLGAALPRTASGRSLAQSSFTDADIFNFALNLEYLQVQVRWRYYSSVSCFEVAFVAYCTFRTQAMLLFTAVPAINQHESKSTCYFENCHQTVLGCCRQTFTAVAPLEFR